MTPNVNVYGQPNTWIHVIPSNSYNEANKNFIPAWETIDNGITAGKINFPDALDNSFSYAAIAEDAPAAGITVCRETEYQTAERQTFSRENILPLYMQTADNGQYRLSNYDLTTNTDIQIYSPNTQLQDNNLNYYVCPMVSMSPADMVFHIGIAAYSADWTEVRYFNTDQYISEYAVTYPHIIQIFASVYFRNENSENRTIYTQDADNIGGFFFGRDIEFDCPAWGTIRDYTATFQHTKGSTTRPILWGICNNGGYAPTYNSPNYVHKFIGADGTIDIKNGNILQYHDFTGDDWIQRVVASYGVFFSFVYSTVTTGALNDSNMYLGVIDADGLCHGNYTQGTANETQQQYTWTSTNDSTYDPTKDYDNTKYDNTTHFNSAASVGSCNKRYIITENVLNKCVKELAAALTTYSENSMTDNSMKAFLTNNPMDCIISVKKFPVNFTVLTEVPLKFGAYTSQDSEIVGGELQHSWGKYQFIFSAANRNNIYPVFGDCFLDYEPYTRAELIIPYCGTVPIPLSDFMNHTIIVELFIDFITGACTAYVKRDQLAVLSISGQAAVDIGISGVQQATLDSQVVNANLQYKAAQLNLDRGVVSTFTSLAKDIPTGNIGSAADTAVNSAYSMKINEAAYDAAQYQNNHIQVPFKQLSASTGVLSLAYEQRCRLVIYRPKLSPDYNADVYAKTVGFACLKNGHVSDFSGLTVGAINLDSVPCTAEEKTMIINDFARGAIL